MANNILEIDKRKDGTVIIKVNHDINGNPRYIIHFTEINESYDKALKAAKEFGFRKCTMKYQKFFICTSYGGFQDVHNRVKEARKILNENNS